MKERVGRGCQTLFKATFIFIFIVGVVLIVVIEEDVQLLQSINLSVVNQFHEIKNNASVSWLTDSLLISETNGVLAICKVNLIHAVILFEYLKRSEEALNHELQRSIMKIDFEPAHKKYSITGKGKAQFKEFVGDETISENIKQLVVGAFWFSETKNILSTFKKIEDEINKAESVPTYSSSGSGSYCKETEFANCLTYAVGVLERYSSELKIEDWQPSKICKALPLPNIWIRIWHREQRKQKSRLDDS